MHCGERIKNIEHINDQLYMNILKVYTQQTLLKKTANINNKTLIIQFYLL